MFEETGAFIFGRRTYRATNGSSPEGCRVVPRMRAGPNRRGAPRAHLRHRRHRAFGRRAVAQQGHPLVAPHRAIAEAASATDRPRRACPYWAGRSVRPADPVRWERSRRTPDARPLPGMVASGHDRMLPAQPRGPGPDGRGSHAIPALGALTCLLCHARRRAGRICRRGANHHVHDAFNKGDVAGAAATHAAVADLSSWTKWRHAWHGPKRSRVGGSDRRLRRQAGNTGKGRDRGADARRGGGHAGLRHRAGDLHLHGKGGVAVRAQSQMTFTLEKSASSWLIHGGRGRA